MKFWTLPVRMQRREKLDSRLARSLAISFLISGCFHTYGCGPKTHVVQNATLLAELTEKKIFLRLNDKAKQWSFLYTSFPYITLHIINSLHHHDVKPNCRHITPGFVLVRTRVRLLCSHWSTHPAPRPNIQLDWPYAWPFFSLCKRIIIIQHVNTFAAEQNTLSALHIQICRSFLVCYLMQFSPWCWCCLF